VELADPPTEPPADPPANPSPASPAEPSADLAPPTWTPPSPAPSSAPDEDKLNLNQATYDQLRRLKLSVTQTGRVLAYRDRLGGFKSLDELDEIVGFPREVIAELKQKLTV
jgi:competence protein ComEA